MKVRSEESRKKYSIAKKKYYENLENRKKASEIAKERIKNHPHTIFQKGYEPWNKNIDRDDERQINAGIKSGKSRQDKKRDKNPKISQKLIGNKNFLNKKHKEDSKNEIAKKVKLNWKKDHAKQLTIEGRQIQRERALKNLKNSKNEFTSIELKFKSELEKRNIEFNQQVIMLNKYRVDFLIEDFIIVECDGNYWHNLPNIKEKDKIRDKIFTENGFVVFRFWEHEINKNVSKCVDQIIEKYHNI